MAVARVTECQAILLGCLFTLILIIENVSDAMMLSSCPEVCECFVSRKYIKCANYFNASIIVFPNDTRQLEIELQYWPVLNASIFANLIHLRKLQLSSSAIEEIESDFTKLQKLKRLDLRNNRLNDSVFNTIGQMKQLKELILDNNQLRLVENNTFSSLEHVELLSLSWNQIEVVPSLQGLKEVQRLYLSNNLIRTVNRTTFSDLYKLEELYLQGNIITQLEPGWMNNLCFLRHLDLSENFLGMQVTHNVIGIESATRLEMLFLSNNSLLHVPCLDLSRSSYLIELNLSYNLIKKLENDCLNRLVFLEVLDLQNNQIEKIEEFALQQMPMLRELSLNNNFIHTLPPYWLKGSRVVRINLNFNSLVSISNDSFSGLEYLTGVGLMNNRISSVTHGAFCGTTIVGLMLHFNELQFINASQFGCAVTLTVLYLNNNFIQDIHPLAFKGISLTELYLHSNLLETITANLILDNNLAQLTLFDNPWICDCRLRWMRNYIDTGNLTSVIGAISENGFCTAPNPVVGFGLLYYFSADYMYCSSFPSPMTIKLILAISISIIGFVVSLNVCKLYCRFRELQKYEGDKEEKTHAL